MGRKVVLQNMMIVTFSSVFFSLRQFTYSCAVPERPRDASCVSVVSFDSTIPRAQSFIISYLEPTSVSDLPMRTIKLCSAVFGVLVDACHKQDSLMRGAAAFVDRGRRTTHKCLKSTVEMLTTRDGPAVIDAKARYCSRIAIFAYSTCIQRPR